jgi:hypothetical protein
MRPWKPSPNPAFDLSAGSPRAQASRGFYSFLYGDSVEFRRARPFAAGGAPCLTLNPHRGTSVFYDHVQAEPIGPDPQIPAS